jgi:hypothetical protein
MPTVQATQSVTIDDFGITTLFNGLIILRTDEASTLAGISPVKNICFSVDNGVVVAAHQCDRTSAVYKLTMPIVIGPASSVLRYYGAWIAGVAKALRADLGVSDSIQQDTVTRLNIPNISTIEVAGLYGYKI